MARSAVAEAMAGQGDGTRHERSEVSVSSADRRSSSARQPLKKVTLSAMQKARSKNNKSQVRVYSRT